MVEHGQRIVVYADRAELETEILKSHYEYDDEAFDELPEELERPGKSAVGGKLHSPGPFVTVKSETGKKPPLRTD